MSNIMQKQPESASLKSEKTKDIRTTNIIAARGKLFYLTIIAVADVVRTSLGPRGMDKMVSFRSEESAIWNIPAYFVPE